MRQIRVMIAVLVLASLYGCPDNGPQPNGPSPLPPTVSSISPGTGSTLGGTAVTVAGTNFNNGASLTLGGTAATNVSVSGSTSLTATTAAREIGTVDVVVRNPDGQTGTLAGGFRYVPDLRANPGGPYSVDAERNITMNGLASTSAPFPIAHYFWNCGQTPHGKACNQDTPTPTFEYLKTGQIGSPNVVYTVTLRIEDTMGNSNTATTTVSVRQVY